MYLIIVQKPKMEVKKRLLGRLEADKWLAFYRQVWKDRQVTLLTLPHLR